MATVAEVHAAGDPVVTAIKEARIDAEGGFFRSDVDTVAANNLKTMEAKAGDLLAKGLAAASSGSNLPVPTGWKGWAASLQILANGAADQTSARAWIVPTLTDTIIAAPAHAAGDIRAGGKFAAGVAKEVGTAVGDVASSAAGGFLTKAWWLVVIALVGAGGYLYFQSRLVRGR